MPAPLAKRLMSYLSLFNPPKRKRLTVERINAILEELVDPITQQQCTHGGVTVVAPHATWAKAIDQMLAPDAGLRLPLRSHGYLFAVVHGLAIHNSRPVNVTAPRSEPEQQPTPAPADARRKEVGAVHVAAILGQPAQRLAKPTPIPPRPRTDEERLAKRRVDELLTLRASREDIEAAVAAASALTKELDQEWIAQHRQ